MDWFLFIYILFRAKFNTADKNKKGQAKCCHASKKFELIVAKLSLLYTYTYIYLCVGGGGQYSLNISSGLRCSLVCNISITVHGRRTIGTFLPEKWLKAHSLSVKLSFLLLLLLTNTLSG